MIDVIAHMSGAEKNVETYGDIFVYNKNVTEKLYKESLD